MVIVLKPNQEVHLWQACKMEKRLNAIISTSAFRRSNPKLESGSQDHYISSKERRVKQTTLRSIAFLVASTLTLATLANSLFNSDMRLSRSPRHYPLEQDQIQMSFLETENISENLVAVLNLNESFITSTHYLQEHLSHLLFWNETETEKQSTVNAISQKHIVQTNYALLKYYTDNVHSPTWKTFLDFSLVSSAFTQLYYLELFKPDLTPYMKFISPTKSNILVYEPLLFPWMKTGIKSLFDSFSGKGIIITTGNYHFHLAFMLVKTLREVLKCELPIEISYADDQDLAPEKRDLISKFKNVRCIDLSALLNANKLDGVGGWWWKVFSILVSSFSEVIFMDADVLFTVDPVVLFSHPNYLEYGNLLFRDRKIHLGNDYERLVKAFPFASGTIRNSALWNKTTTHEAESGVLVYNKKDPAAFFALLNTCNLDRNPMQKVSNSFFHGDKETFWISYELLMLPYAFVQPYGATVGYSPTPGTVCGSLAHSDENGNLLWFNGGLAVDKGGRADEIYDFQYWATDNNSDKVGKWTWEEGHLEKLCWEAPFPETEVRELSADQKTKFEAFIAIYKAVRKGELQVGGTLLDIIHKI